jgi:uncharacterized membrane protein YdbT with pleckstrin-like domain
VPELTIRPTAKGLKAGAALAGLMFLALEVLCLTRWNAAVGSPLIMIPPVLLLCWPAARAIRRHFTKAVLTADWLRYETGILGRTTRTIQLAKVQDVRVDQGLLQRILGIGNLSVETAGAEKLGDFTLRNVDDPQGLAHEILTRAQRGTAHMPPSAL